MKSINQNQFGASLIEVLVAVLVLSFGMLAMGGMLSYAVQLPKLSGYRATAALIAQAHVDRMRANLVGFKGGAYATAATSYNTTIPVITTCTYPNCLPGDIATLDQYQTNNALRQVLPGNTAGIYITCVGTCDNAATGSNEGNLWIIWDEPSTTVAFSSTGTSDECPTGLTGAQTVAPRCLLVRFKL